MKYILAFIFALTLTACATARPVDVQNRLNAWVGQDADALVRSWGPPDRSYDFRDGSKVIEYERNRVDSMGGWNHPRGSVVVGADGTSIGVGAPLLMDEPSVIVRRCLIKFETDRRRTIRRATFDGPNCAYAIVNTKS